jgi:broad specificity phosphatase PhoE
MENNTVELRVIFGRHGISCANLRKKTQTIPGYHTLYSDPELSYEGRLHLHRLGLLFRKQLEMKNPVVCASGLIRAQQTAYGMTHADKIFVVPHICETDSYIQTADNTPLSQPEQEAVLQETCQTDLIGRLDRTHYIPTDLSNFETFKQWFAQHWSALSNNDPSRLFVFFSHGGFIRSFLKKITGNKDFPKIKNYECHELKFVVNTVTKKINEVIYVGRFDYGEGELPRVNPDAECGHDTCRFKACLKSTRREVPAEERCTAFSPRVNPQIKRSNNVKDPRHLVEKYTRSTKPKYFFEPVPVTSRRRKRYNCRKTRKH